LNNFLNKKYITSMEEENAGLSKEEEAKCWEAFSAFDKG
jgi:hypothetical protein